MPRADDFNVIGKYEYSYRGGDEVVAMDQGVCDQFLEHDTRDFGIAFGIDVFVPLEMTEVAEDEGDRVIYSTCAIPWGLPVSCQE